MQVALGASTLLPWMQVAWIQVDMDDSFSY